MSRSVLLSLLLIVCFLTAGAQSEKQWLKHQIKTLSRDAFHGRGYVGNGTGKAAAYMARFFHGAGLRSFSPDSSYLQPYRFPVNTFPREMYLKLQRKEMIPGADYIIHAASSGRKAEKLRVKPVNLALVRDSTAWDSLRTRLHTGHAWLLHHTDTLLKNLQLNARAFASSLPDGVFLIPKHGKLTWTVARNVIPATVYYIEDTVMPRRIRKVSLHADHKFEEAYLSQNVIGYVPGTERPDSFLVFTAHFDHLGRMGRKTIFPGAHDNASGTAVVMYLAQHFAKNPQRYSMVFIGFSGEEAGLMGSAYFVDNPLFPLANIRFVVNLDMTGDATDGITIVNALEQEEAWHIIDRINQQHDYLPKINRREQTRNSDHYYFGEKGVPAVFIFGLGAKGYYHDIFDRPEALTLHNIDRLIRLLIDFSIAMQQ